VVWHNLELSGVDGVTLVLLHVSSTLLANISVGELWLWISEVLLLVYLSTEEPSNIGLHLHDLTLVLFGLSHEIIHLGLFEI